MSDILIRGGTLFDGSGRAAETGDVLIEDGRIAAIGQRVAQSAETIVEAAGLAVTPGFIDIKTHSDFTLPINPKAESKVRQGVTTEIIGHCGFSVAPALPGKVELLEGLSFAGAPWTPFREMSFGEYLDTFPESSVNAGMLVGHNTLRLMVMGMEDRAPTADELGAMIELLEEGLRSRRARHVFRAVHAARLFAEPEEMHAFGRVLKRYNAAYFTHIRDESNKVLDAVEEAIAVARDMRGPCRDRAFQMFGHDNWGKAAETCK